MYTIEVEIEGVAALLQQRFAVEEAGGVKKTTGAPDWSTEWKKALYTQSGEVVQPAIHVESAMATSAVNFKIPGKRGKSFRDLFKAAVFVSPEMIPHGVPVPEELDTETMGEGEMYLDVRPVVVSRSRVLRYRPGFRAGWRLKFQIEVHDDEIPLEVVQQTLELAGQRVGIGDYRPRFGRFRIVHFDKKE